MNTRFDNKNLKAEMVKKDITKKDLAKFLNLSNTTINSIFSGKRDWKYIECIKIAKAFFPDKSLSYLFKYNDEDSQ